jgi:RNA polymerase sigma factor FliA
MLEAAVSVHFDPVSQGCGLSTLEKAFRECEARLGRPATNLEVCSELGLNLKDFYSLLDLHSGIGLGRVDTLEFSGADAGEEPCVKYVPHPEEEESGCVCSKLGFELAMAQALETLPKNEKLVVALHHNEALSMREIAQVFGISEARVAQIHTTAMLRIRGKLQSLDGD